MLCPYCRREIRDNALLCPFCGRAVQTIDRSRERHVETKQPAPKTPNQTPVVQKSSSSHKRAAFVAIAVVVLLAAVVAVFFLRQGGVSSALVVPSTVKVFGTASSSGSGTYVSQVIFTDAYGTTYPAQVSNGQYSISLTNPGSYTVQVKWVGAFYWQGGAISVSPLNLNIGAGSVRSISEAFNVSTPDSSINVTGTALTNNGVGNQTLQITFNSSNGESYSTHAFNGKYSISLPNNQVYSVQITTSSGGQTGYPTTCTAGYIDIDTYPGYNSYQAGPSSC